MENMKRILSYTRRGVDDYSMIEEGDKIAVGVSAGKDSLTLLCAMAQLRRFYPKKFELIAITIDMGFEGGMDFEPIKKLCEELDVPYHIVPTEIYKIIFEVRKESSPCSLCAKMRRGSLHAAAVELGCNKVALGHHNDDALDTFMLSLVYEGRVNCFSPVTYLDRKDITLIRPLIYAPEKDIKYFVRHNDLPVSPSLCPEDKHTEREEINELVTSLDKKYKGFKHRAFGAIQKSHIDGY